MKNTTIFSLFKRSTNKNTPNKNNQKEIKIEYHNFDEITTTKELVLSDIQNLSEEDINNFIYINPLAKIELLRMQSGLEKSYDCSDEVEYLNTLKNIFKILSTHNRTYNISIRIENRELLSESGILNIPNINLTIWNDCYEYKKEEYLKEEEKIDKMIFSIKESNLSPYEKYLAAYNLVKQFKPYKDSKKNKDHARYLRYILNNEYMVCVGYARLFKTFLDKLGIPSIQIGVDIDISYDEGYSKENIPTRLRGHERLIVKIDDDKWNIHGIFISDPTWDNSIEYDLYNNSAITFDKKKEARRLERLTEYDLLLDFHTFDDFTIKINYYLKRKIKESYKKTYQDKLIHSYKKIYDKIVEILMQLDYPKYIEIINKYEKLIKDIMYGRISDMKQIEDTFASFLTNYAMYIIPLSNKKIPDNILYQAARNVKTSLEGYGKEEIKEWNKYTRKINQMVHSFSFPYSYNPKDTRINYLKTRGKIKIKSKTSN